MERRLQECLEGWPCLGIAGAALAASFLLSGGHEAHGVRWSDPAWIALVICGLPIVREALVSLVAERRIRTALLLTCAMVACVSIGQLFAAGEIAFIMAIGENLEDWTVSRATKGLSKLVSLVPKTARRREAAPGSDGTGATYREVPVEDIAPGDVLRILPGETVPVDGVVADGASSIDASVMTGESLPVDVVPGDVVHSGCSNLYGAISVSATKAGKDSSLQTLVKLVEEAGRKKAPAQRVADMWASRLVPCSLALAIATFLVAWGVLGDAHEALLRGVTVLVVFCPCALALATPTSVMAAIGQASKYGVIVKSGEALERMGNVGVLCLDKTGTLTTGRISVVRTIATGDAAEEEVLVLAAAAESSSEHPLAKAIVAEAARRGLRPPTPDLFTMVPGKGVEATTGGRRILCGNAAWLAEHGVVPDAAADGLAERLRREGHAVVAVAAGADGAPRVIGLVALADTVRPDAEAMLSELPGVGLRPVLLTGDHGTTARHVAETLGIADVRAGLLPSGKAAAIEDMRRGGAEVAMVGDGVNDAPALRTASVGIAMGGIGSDIAVEAADIALVGDDLTKLAYLKRLSNACIRLIGFNIATAMTINACAIVCSMLGLLSPVAGALVHNAGSVLVILNAALLYDRDYRRHEGRKP